MAWEIRHFHRRSGGPRDPPTCTGQGGDPNLKLFPYAFWNLNVQHAFTNNLSLDVGYVGSRTWSLINTVNLNQPTGGISGSSPTTAGSEYFRTPYNFAANNGTGSVYPWFGTINYLVNAGGSNYAGLQMNLTARNVHGFTLNANYTFSHALVQTFEQATGQLNNGNNALDTTHHLSLQASYAIPAIKEGAWSVARRLGRQRVDQHVVGAASQSYRQQGRPIRLRVDVCGPLGPLRPPGTLQ